jgi:hypothetical protein
VASYYNAYGRNLHDQIEGIVFVVLSTFLLVLSLCFRSEEAVGEAAAYVQLVQMVGLMRVRALPIVLSVYNVFVGFSYYELQYIPNPLTYFISTFTLQEAASDSATLVYGSQNIIYNFGSLLCVAAFLLLISLLVLLVLRNDESGSKVGGLVVKAIVEYFLFVVLYGCLLSLTSLDSNSLTNSNALFASSIVLSLAIVILCAAYFIKHAHEIL